MQVEGGAHGFTAHEVARCDDAHDHVARAFGYACDGVIDLGRVYPDLAVRQIFAKVC